MKWKTIEDQWDEQYSWFLVDEGKIHCAFKNRITANTYSKMSHIGYMLLINLDDISDIMIDPSKYSSWSGKIQTCIDIVLK